MPAEILVPADAELAAITELSTRYPALGFAGLTMALKTVGTKIPTTSPKPSDFVRVLAVGGTGRDLVTDAPTLVLEGWSTIEGRAFQICARGVAALQAAGRDGSMGGVTCYEVGVFGLPAKLPDPTVTTHFRFTSTISADLRRSTV